MLDLREDEDGVELRTIRLGEERERTIRGDWVVGCDGAHSLVRRSLGLSFDGEDSGQDWPMAEVNIDRALARDHFHLFTYTAAPLPVLPRAMCLSPWLSGKDVTSGGFKPGSCIRTLGMTA